MLRLGMQYGEKAAAAVPLCRSHPPRHNAKKQKNMWGAM
jgi:hypothetical protein